VGIDINTGSAYPGDYGGGYTIYGSNSSTTCGASWGSSLGSSSGSALTSIAFSQVTYRYVKVMLNASARTGSWWAVAEFKVYATGGSTVTATISSSTTVAAVSMGSAITVTQAAGQNLTVTGGMTVGSGTTYNASTGDLTIGGDLTVSGGTFTGSSGRLDVTGDFLFQSGTFTAPSSLFRVGSTYNQTGGTYTHNSGRLLLNASGARAFVTNGSTFSSVFINDGLLGYWPFEETATSSADYSGWGRTATWYNSADDNAAHGTTNFANNRSLGFVAGSNSYATMAEAPEVTDISISVWAYSSSRTTQYPRIIDMPAYEISFTDGSGIAPQVNHAIAWTATTSGNAKQVRTPTSSISDGAWYHIVATMTSAGTATVYINGALQALTEPNGAMTGTMSSNAGIGHIGNSPALNRPWNGYIDDLRIYNRVLTAADVTMLYNGGQRTVANGSQTLSAALTAASDLVIAGGTFDVSASNYAVNVGGSFYNFGGTFTPRSGTVTLNGTSASNVIRSDRAPFYNLTINNTGTWTLQDRLTTTGALTMSAAGTLAASSYSVHAGSLNKTAGTLSGTGKVTVEGTGSTTLSVNSLSPELHVEVPRETGLVGYWKLDEGYGTSFADLSGSGNTGTLSTAGRWVTSSLAGTGFDNQAAVNLGGDSYGTLGVTNIPSLSAAKSITCWVKITTTAGVQHMVSYDDTAGNSIGVGIRGGALQAWKGGGSVLATTSAPSLNTWVHVAYTWDGTTNKIYLDGGTPGTSTTSPNSGTVTRGFIGTWDGINELLWGQIDEVRSYNVALTAAQVKNLAAGRYSGVGTTGNTATLGANSAVSTGLFVDNGTLATSTYTMNSSSTSAAVAVNSGGVYQVGSALQTMAGGLTVQNGGTLTLPSTGDIAIADGKILTMDGTLNASNTGAAIQSVSGTYYFRVGSVSGATPTLNISGLQVKNTTADGMYVNYNTGATTTFTQFDNIAFSSGAGTGAGNYNLSIYAAALYLTASGCTFDSGVTATVNKNVRLIGNGITAGSETRVVFGGSTCASNQASCEAYDADDDSADDGTGDTTMSNGAVVQWVKTAATDTAGTIEGFPTAAFDWSNFTYYATYVAYHDTSGTADTVYVRGSSGAAAYSWSTSSGEELIGTPRWDMAGGVKYVYVATTSGKVYRLVDNGSTLTAATASPWDGVNNPYNCTCTITTPLAQDTSNLYFGGNASGTHKIWTVSKTSTTRVPAGSPLATSTTTSNAAPALWVSGSTYAYLGLAGRVSKINVSTQANVADNTNPASTNAVTGRITVVHNALYAGDDNGYLWKLDPGTNFGASSGLYKHWGYRDTTNHAACGGVCQVKSHYYDPTATNVYFGDGDGHLYVINSSGSAKTGYPYRPGTSSDVYQTAPFHRTGVLLAGTTTGTLYIIDQSTNGTTPGVIRKYEFGASTKISGIAYSPNVSAYMVSTANDTNKDGKLYYIDVVSDPTSSYP
jgi:hypothetical protein